MLKRENDKTNRLRGEERENKIIRQTEKNEHTHKRKEKS
jgi:hypothetical protein